MIGVCIYFLSYCTVRLVFYQGCVKLGWINPLPPSGSETEKCISEDFFSSVLSRLKKYHPSGNLKFNNLGIFQSLKLRNSMGKVLRISLKLIFTPNTLGWVQFRHQQRTWRGWYWRVFEAHGKKGFVVPTKSFVKIGITKIFCYNNKMFSSINNTFGCCSKIFGWSNKKLICCCPNFFALTKPFFPWSLVQACKIVPSKESESLIFSEKSLNLSI